MDLPPLNVVFESIPAAYRGCLNETLQDSRSRAKIARSLGANWKTVAQYLPNIQSDIDGIEHDNRNNLELQQIALLRKWQERNGSWATYRQLAECLYEARAMESLHVLCKELEGDKLLKSSADPSETSPSPQHSLQLASPVTAESQTEVQHQPLSPQPCPMTSQYVQAKIRRFEKRFNELKKATRVCLEKRNISVKQIVDALTSMPADDMEEHKQFLKENLADLYHSSDISELFGKLSLHWDYLSYQLLDYLIKEFGLELKSEMEKYKLDLQCFRQKTPLALFCQSQTRRRRRPSEEFQEMVAEFDWPHEVTLEVVEQFRQEYAYHYKLRECAMMLSAVRPGSFIITWFIPESIVEKLQNDIPNQMLKKYSVINLKISGVSIFPSSKKSTKRPTSSHTPSDQGEFEDFPPQAKSLKMASAPESLQELAAQPLQSESHLSPEEEYHFVDKPSEDNFCPVTKGLLLQPHLTSCCGKHLSEESAIRIQREGGPCPLCKSPDWNTVLDKHVRRQVRELHVYCRHKEKGCWWKGELSNLTNHVKSCSFRFVEECSQERTELHDAAERGDVETIRTLLLTAVNINSRTEDDGETALHIASKRGYVEIVSQLLKAHAGLNIVDKTGRTPLFWASGRAHKAIVEPLLEYGADVTICDENGFSPLYVASHEGNTDIVDILIEAGAHVNQATTTVPFTAPLGIAAEKGHTETVKTLLKAGANVNYQDNSGQTPLWSSSWSGHTAVVQLLIENGADINIREENDSSPLYIACQEGHADVVSLLIEAGANINETATEKGVCPVYAASQGGHTDVVDVLVKAGADVNQPCIAAPHSVPLGIAAGMGFTETVQRLLDAGAHINHQSQNKQTPVWSASWKGHTATVQLLVDNGADLSICNDDGFSPLFAACEKGKTDIVDILIRAGANIHQVTTKLGSDPLEVAAGEGHTDIVERLLKAGADVNHQNKDGSTALLYAGQGGHLEVVKLLLGAGARDIPNKFGDTALTLARTNSHSGVVKYLLEHQQQR